MLKAYVTTVLISAYFIHNFFYLFQKRSAETVVKFPGQSEQLMAKLGCGVDGEETGSDIIHISDKEAPVMVIWPYSRIW